MKQVFSLALAVFIALAAVSSPAADFNGDGLDDIAIFRPSTGLWSVRGYTRVYFGTDGDIPTPGRWTQGVRDQIAIFRPSTGLWSVQGGARNYFGTDGDIPLGFGGGGGGGGSDVWTQNGNKIYYNLGSVGVGTTNPYYRIHCHTNSSNHSYLQFTNSTTGYGDLDGVLVGLDPNEDFRIHSYENNNIRFYTSNSARFTIDSTGDVGIGTTTPANRLDVRTSHSGGYALSLYNSAGTLNSHGLRIRSGAVRSGHSASENVLIWFARGTDNVKVGSINHYGTETRYNTSSDERLKENIADAASPSGLIDALRVRQFDWKESGGHQRYGFVAQELEEVAPEAVTRGNEEDENDYWGVDNSKLVPMLVKEIQELRARVSELESR